MEALETSSLVGQTILDSRLPSGVIVAAVLRSENIIRVDKNTQIHSGDRVILFATKEAIRKVEKLFAVRLEFF